MWKQISSSPNYIVSTNGNVVNTKTGRELKHSMSSKGYAYVGLATASKPKAHRIHRLVAEAFIPNPLNKPYVNHIDGNKLNNTVSNLEWCTALENNLHAYKTGLITQDSNRVLTCMQQAFVQSNYIKGSRKYGSNALAKLLGVSSSTILNYLK